MPSSAASRTRGRDERFSRPAGEVYRVHTSRPAERLIRQVAALHVDALGHRSFITEFGAGFLRALYRALLDLRIGFLVTATRGSRLAGFVLACTDSARLMTPLVRRWYRLAPAVAWTLLRRPGLAANLFGTLSYPLKEAADVKPELVVIAVRREHRSRGIGRALVGALEKEFGRRGVVSYKVTVHAAMTRANRFYRRRHMTRLRTFRLYGVPWNVYVRRLSAVTRGGGPGPR